ncbi:MAG: tetratricopeptide repeat protein, partial [Proteobacteria bacterium]|nr:tetratricopeptide repeat protein [Pseudomonadota bacterium]
MAADPTYQDQFQKGKALFEAGDFKGAARLFIPLLETSPEDLDLRQYLTRAYAAFGYFAEAVETFRPNFEQMPEAHEKYGYFGNLCFLAGFAGEALSHLGKAHQMAPGNAEIPSAMALCH